MNGYELSPRLVLSMKRLPGSDFYNSKNAFSTELCGIKLEYLPVPKTFLDRHGYGTRLGFKEDGKIFVNKHLHEAQMPVVALFLHLKSLENNENERLLNLEQGTLDGLNDNQLHDAYLSATLDYASDFLYKKEVVDLIKKFKEEPGYDPLTSEGLFADFSRDYLSDKSLGAIIRRADQQLELYTERVSDHIRRFNKSTYNKRMDSLQCAVAADKGIENLFGTDVTKARHTYRTIKESPQLSAMIPEIVELLTRIEDNTTQNDLIEVDAKASGILYLCSAAYIDAKSAPIVFIDGIKVSDPTNNIVEVSTYGKRQFLPSLKRLLMQDVVREIDELNASLEGIEKVVVGVQTGDRDALTIAAQYVRQITDGQTKECQIKEIGLVRNNQTTAMEIQKGVQLPTEEYKTTLAFIVTGATETNYNTFQAAHALSTLVRLGFPISDDQLKAVSEMENKSKYPQLAAKNN